MCLINSPRSTTRKHHTCSDSSFTNLRVGDALGACVTDVCRRICLMVQKFGHRLVWRWSEVAGHSTQAYVWLVSRFGRVARCGVLFIPSFSSLRCLERVRGTRHEHSQSVSCMMSQFMISPLRDSSGCKHVLALPIPSQRMFSVSVCRRAGSAESFARGDPHEFSNIVGLAHFISNSGWRRLSSRTVHTQNDKRIVSVPDCCQAEILHVMSAINKGQNT